jgi:O-antigen ligase
MVITMALCLSAAVIWFGAVTIDVAAPAYALAAVLALLWAGKLLFSRAVSWKASPLHWPVLAFVVYATVRYFTSPIEYEGRIELLQIWLLAFVYFLCAFNFYRSRDRTIIFAVLLALGLGEALYGMWQFGTKSDQILHWVRHIGYRGRASGTYFCPNHLAGFLEMVIALAIGRTAIQRFSRSKVQKSALQKIFVIYITLFLIAALLMTLSRSSWMAVALALATLFFWGEWDWRLLWPRLAVAAAAICLIGIAAFTIKPVRFYIQDTLAGEQKKDGSALRDPTFGGRTLMWSATVAIIRDQPLVGTGPGTWQWFHPKYRPAEYQAHSEHAHNDILQLASDYGLIGFGIVAWAFVAFFRHASLIARRNASSEQRSFAVGSALAVTAILFHSWLDFNMHILANPLVMVALMGMTVAMDDEDERYRRLELNRFAKYALGLALFLAAAAAVWFVRPAALAVHYSSEADDLTNILEWDRALVLYQRAIALDPKFPEPHSRSGQVYLLKAKWKIGENNLAERKRLAQLSIASFEKSLALNPHQAGVLIRAGNAYELVGDLERARACFDRALALEPRSSAVHAQAGLFFRRAGDEPAAIAAFEKSNRLHGNIVSGLNILELKAHR